MDPVLRELFASGPALTDGAWGTQLQALGLPIGACPDAWNLAHPDRVAAVARAYVAAGSRVLLTNTFRAHRAGLAACGLAARVVEINRAAVAIARAAAGPRVRVFGSIGPLGRGPGAHEDDAESSRAAFAEQASALAGAGADAIVLETFYDLDEARTALNAARATGLPVVACVTFIGVSPRGDDNPARFGFAPEVAARALTEAGAAAVGANCIDPGSATEICRRLRAATDRPIWIKPNAGLPVIAEGRAEYRTTPGDFARHARALVAAGASFLGGCCGTGPDHIRALHDLLGRDTLPVPPFPERPEGTVEP